MPKCQGVVSSPILPCPVDNINAAAVKHGGGDLLDCDHFFLTVPSTSALVNTPCSSGA